MLIHFLFVWLFNFEIIIRKINAKVYETIFFTFIYSHSISEHVIFFPLSLHIGSAREVNVFSGDEFQNHLRSSNIANEPIFIIFN